MKSTLSIKALSLSALLFCVGVAALADDDLSSKEGYFDFDSLTAEYGEPTVRINLGSTLLKLVSRLKHGDPATAEALSNLEHVRVHVYSTAGDTAAAAAQMAGVGASLEAEHWEKIVQVREEGEQVDIFLNSGPTKIYGLLVMAVDDDEAVFVNVLGDINPETLGVVLENVDVDISL